MVMKKVLIVLSSLILIGIIICLLLIFDIYDRRMDYSIILNKETLVLEESDTLNIKNNGKNPLYIWKDVSFPESEFYRVSLDKEYILLKPKEEVNIKFKAIKNEEKYYVNNIYCSNTNVKPNSIEGYSFVKKYNIMIKSK